MQFSLRLWLALAILAVASPVWADSWGTNCLEVADPDFYVLDQPILMVLNGHNPEAGYTCHYDSIIWWGNGNGDIVEIYLYYREVDGFLWDCVQTHGPFTDTIVGTGEQRMSTVIDQEIADTTLTYVVLFNCNTGSPQIQCHDDDAAASVVYVETSDADCSANAGYYDIDENAEERVHFCIYYTLTPVPSGENTRRRKLLIGGEDESEKIHMVYCSADDSHSEL